MYFWLLVAGVSSRWPGFDPGSSHADLLWKMRYWSTFYPSTSVSVASHYTNCSTLIAVYRSERVQQNKQWLTYQTDSVSPLPRKYKRSGLFYIIVPQYYTNIEQSHCTTNHATECLHYVPMWGMQIYLLCLCSCAHQCTVFMVIFPLYGSVPPLLSFPKHENSIRIINDPK
jgi:hypothetical protein